jgi:pimeloyl-ACP methyl ester carboxylesterase
MQEGDIRYDRVMLGIVEEVAEKYGRRWGNFAMFGYSGGGHFAHRFAILHPRKLWAACIGAPGSVTLLDPERDWWVGIRNLKEKFGIAFDGVALARVPVQMLVGEADSETWEITHQPGDTYWMEGANDAGRTRPERLRALQQSFEAAGVKVRFELLAGVSHSRLAVIARVQDFLAAILKDRRS